jgi:hypothetical protein
MKKRTIKIGCCDDCPLKRYEYDSGFGGSLWHCYYPGRKKDKHGYVRCDHAYLGEGCPLQRTDLVLTLDREKIRRRK